MDVSTAAQAEQMVQEYVAAEFDHDFVVLSDKTRERPFGWVVFYNTPAYLASGHPRDQVPGAGPVVVLRDGGEIVPLTTSVPPEVGIRTFEETWEKTVEFQKGKN